MSEFLTVRLSSEHNVPIQWLVWSTNQSEVIASGQLDSYLQLEELVPYAQQRTTIVLLSSSDVVMTTVDIPAGAARQFESMLPYLVEDEIAQDADELHFSVLEKSGQKASVCGVDQNWLSQILGQFKQLGIEIKKVLPDGLALPVVDNGMSAMQVGQQWLMRKNAYQAVAVDQDWLPLFCQSDWFLGSEADTEGAAEQSIQCYSELPDESVLVSSTCKWEQQPATLVMQILAQEAIASSINLLTGHFKPKSSLLKYWKTWQKVAIASTFLIAVLATQQVLLVNQYEAQVKAYRAESERIFRSVFPDKRKIPTVSYLKRQMTTEQQRLSGSGQADSMLTWINLLPKTLGTISSIELQSLKYDGNRGEVRLQASGADFQNFEQARVKLSEQFNVEQGQLNRTGDSVMGSFVLKRK